MEISENLENRDFSTLTIDEWREVFDAVREEKTSAPKISTSLEQLASISVIQYWDIEPDKQILALLENNRQLCEKNNINWCLFNERSAFRFLESEFGRRYAAAFQKCFHPAMKADLFRYAYTYKNGGMWLDADFALIGSPYPLLSLTRPVFWQRNTVRRNIANSFFISTPLCGIVGSALEMSVRNIENEQLMRQCRRDRSVMPIAGPPVLEHAVAEGIYSILTNNVSVSLPKIVDEMIFDQFVVNGGGFLGEPLNYKMSKKSWQYWQNKELLGRISRKFRKLVKKT